MRPWQSEMHDVVPLRPSQLSPTLHTPSPQRTAGQVALPVQSLSAQSVLPSRSSSTPLLHAGASDGLV